MATDILFEHINQIGLITLNRPEALNALTHQMILDLDQQLQAWENNNNIKAIIIRGTGDKAFCAGGDIRKIYDAGKAHDKSILTFFWDEYRLNRRIHNYSKPYISFLDGITMGGGVGISMHGSHRIGTEKLRFAMPETGIGFFPDIGGSYLLSRCPGETGIYLALTGARLKVADTMFLALVDNYVASDQLNNLLDQLTATKLDNTQNIIAEIIESFSQTPEPSELADEQYYIDKHFAAASVEEILQALEQSVADWCHTVAKTMKTKSPTSLKVTLQQIRAGKVLGFDICMQVEYRMVNRFIDGHDFYEGVRSLIVDKDNHPQWQPASLEDVAHQAVEKYFQPLSQELSFA